MSTAAAAPSPAGGAGPRTTGRVAAGEVVSLGASLLLTVVVLDLLLTGGLGVLLDVGLLATCLLLAVQVRPGDFFVVGVAPPLLLVGALAVAGLGSAGTGALGVVVGALGEHSSALVVTEVLTLAVLAARAAGVTRSGPGPLPRA